MLFSKQSQPPSSVIQPRNSHTSPTPGFVSPFMCPLPYTLFCHCHFLILFHVFRQRFLALFSIPLWWPPAKAPGTSAVVVVAEDCGIPAAVLMILPPRPDQPEIYSYRFLNRTRILTSAQTSAKYECITLVYCLFLPYLLVSMCLDLTSRSSYHSGLTADPENIAISITRFSASQTTHWWSSINSI